MTFENIILQSQFPTVDHSLTGKKKTYRSIKHIPS